MDRSAICGRYEPDFRVMSVEFALARDPYFHDAISHSASRFFNWQNLGWASLLAIPPDQMKVAPSPLSRRDFAAMTKGNAMGNQPSLPELPPMKAATVTPPVPSSPAPTPARPVTGGVRRLRQILGYLAGGGMMLVAVILLFELVAKPGLRPSDLMAMVEARVELGVMNQKMGHAPGEHVLTEAQYQEIIAQAQRQGAAKAEIGFQRELAAVQADKERVVGAYQTLYQRANAIAQAAIQLETIAQQFRQQLLAMSNGGRSMVIGIKDLFCGLGSPEACASAHQDRASMISESDELSRGDVGKRVRELMQGVDDPATFISHEDRRHNGTPKIRR